jgi:beta-lactamase class A
MAALLMLLMAVAGPSPAAYEEMAAPAKGTIGFAALDVSTGQSFGWHERDAFPMQSVFKLPIAIEVLHQVDDKKLDLARVVELGPSDARGGPGTLIKVPAKKTVRELLEPMIITSDNTATDKLLSLLGGPRVVEARMRSLGIEQITIRYSELEMAARKDNTATPAAMVALLAKIARRQVGLSAASGALRIKGGVPPGTPVAHKTGMSDTFDGVTDATNDVGLITMPNGHRIAVAVFVRASRADIATRERTIARLARAAYDAFNGSNTGNTAPR